MGSGGSSFTEHIKVLDNPLLATLAKKYNKTPAEIALRWNVQLGHSVLPKSTNANRLEQNIDIFDFEISEEDMEKFNSIEQVSIYSLHLWLVS
jgi:diketogulonate reductase-like aldo/keto reductase